ncbi:peptidylprolyl isomerase [candidate division KSB1 bacterium]|nr:peptidylprolyl isomerase [candidate division KSB1 bacterium]
MLDRIVAVVDDDIILLSELQQQAYKLAFEFKVDVQRDPEKFNELMKQVLDNLIIQKILFVKAKEDTIVADDNHVESEIESRINYFTRELGSPEKVEEYFGSPISKIKRTLREEIRQGLMAQQVRDQKIRDIKISRREVLELYRSMGDSLPTIKEQVHIANLMVKVKPGEEARQVALRRITAIQKTLQDSADFKELASQVSDDPGSAAAGGELGFFNRGQLVKEFEEVAFGLKPGETSDIVESPFGFHIIQPIERRGEKINCRHILVSLVPTEEDEKQTVELIKQIYDKIASDSVSFETMVEKYSDDIESKDKAGDLGWFPEDDLQIKEFQTALKDLKPGEISYPFKTKYGYHILKLLDRQQPRELSLDEDWEQIERWALNLKQQKEFLAWVEELKEDIYIRVDKIDD